jgi:hypothetical protein
MKIIFPYVEHPKIMFYAFFYLYQLKKADYDIV